jgi:nucleoside 2-deoxyribosyltransferase
MNPYESYGLYIAGPECFYPRGYSLWHAQRNLAEYYGFTVVLPNDFPLKLDHEDLRKNADEIFANLRDVIEHTDIIIADLEFFRGSEPDGGTLFEMGMTYAKGGLLYGYTRDKRPMVNKNQYIHLDKGQIKAQNEEVHFYADMAFVPSIIASTMLIEGDFHDCLKTAMADLEERKKRIFRAGTSIPSPLTQRDTEGRKTIFLSGPTRYAEDGITQYAKMKKICTAHGFNAISPLDGAEDMFQEIKDPIIRSCKLFDHWQEALRRSDLFLGDINDYHGMEPCGDTAFESGAAWKLGKKCYAYRNIISKMRDRIPNIDGFDAAGNVVENFNYPVNLMFSSSMPVLEGPFERVIESIARDLSSQN